MKIGVPYGQEATALFTARHVLTLVAMQLEAGKTLTAMDLRQAKVHLVDVPGGGDVVKGTALIVDFGDNILNVDFTGGRKL